MLADSIEIYLFHWPFYLLHHPFSNRKTRIFAYDWRRKDIKTDSYPCLYLLLHVFLKAVSVPGPTQTGAASRIKQIEISGNEKPAVLCLSSLR